MVAVRFSSDVRQMFYGPITKEEKDLRQPYYALLLPNKGAKSKSRGIKQKKTRIIPLEKEGFGQIRRRKEAPTRNSERLARLLDSKNHYKQRSQKLHAEVEERLCIPNTDKIAPSNRNWKVPGKQAGQTKSCFARRRRHFSRVGNSETRENSRCIRGILRVDRGHLRKDNVLTCRDSKRNALRSGDMDTTFQVLPGKRWKDRCLERNPGYFLFRPQKDPCPAASCRGDRKNTPCNRSLPTQTIFPKESHQKARIQKKLWTSHLTNTCAGNLRKQLFETIHD